MPRLTVEIQRCEGPTVDAAGRKFGPKVYDTAGNKYSAGKLFSLFREGGTYEIFYEDKVFQGHAYKSIENVVPVSAAAVAATASAPQAQKSMEIWVNSMMQRAIDHDKLDPWSEEACVEYGEIQKRVYGRLFLGEEARPLPTQANGPVVQQPHITVATSGLPPQTKAYPGTADALSDEIPF